METRLKIGVVGACGTGKSELVSRLNQHGYYALQIAQEHSFVPGMWQKLSKPDILIYLQASYRTTILRKKFHWTENEYQEQLHRLRHAKANADLIVDTDQLTLDEVFRLVGLKLIDLESSSFTKSG